MATLEISYWTATEFQGGNLPSGHVISETLTVTATSAQSGVIPPNADIVSIYANGAAARARMGVNPTATAASFYIGSGERLWLKAKPNPNGDVTVAGILA
jgi:hypothetical protein